MRVLEDSRNTATPLRESSWDWSSRINLPKVRDQGAYQACVPCAIVGMIEARHQIRRQTRIRLMPGYIHTCMFHIVGTKDSVDAAAALTRIQSEGVGIGNDDRIPLPSTACQPEERYRIQDCGWIMGKSAILNHLVEHGPVLVTMDIETGSFSNLRDDVYNLPQNAASPVRHAVLLTGYDDRPGAGWASFMNSAGAGWGVGGIGRARIGSGGLITRWSAAAALLN